MAEWEDGARLHEERQINKEGGGGSQTLGGKERKKNGKKGRGTNSAQRTLDYLKHATLVEFMYLLACQVIVTTGDSGLCCCVPCHTCDIKRAQLSPFACGFHCRETNQLQRPDNRDGHAMVWRRNIYEFIIQQVTFWLTFF